MSETNEMDAIEMIRREREHQIARGWTPSHDDAHAKGEIAEFAATLLWAAMEGYDGFDMETFGEDYPRIPEWVGAATDHALRKHPEPVARLRIVAALIVAEMERLTRASEVPHV